MSPQKSRSKQQLYCKKDIRIASLVKQLLYEERYPIAGARRRLRELGVGKALEGTASPPQAGAVGGHSEYRRIRDELAAIRALV